MRIHPGRFLLRLGLVVTLGGSLLAGPKPPNVLFISVDDMRAWTGFLDGYEGPVHTPHLDQLAAQGINFTNAHCSSPVCGPSRAAVMTGRRASTTGIYGNSQWLRPHRPDIITLPTFLKSQGYLVAGAGKSFHHTAGNNPPDQWHDYFRFPWEDIAWMRQNRLNYPRAPDAEPPEGFRYSNVPLKGEEEDWGVLPIPESAYDDSRVIDYGLEFLNQSHDRPFFLSIGTFHPHLPWYVPQRFRDLYDPSEIVIPQIDPSDLDDVPPGGLRFAAFRRPALHTIQQADALTDAVHHYLAAISFTDELIGRLLSALENSVYANNTLIVLWSDHGYHHGEKYHFSKTTLWEEATRVPFIIKLPGPDNIAGESDRPVSLLDIFPTLVSQLGMQFPQTLDGNDLSPLLRDPGSPWPHPAIIEMGPGNAAVRDERWRYIRYAADGQELYDHHADPAEKINLAADPAYDHVKTELAEHLPQSWAEPAPTKSAYAFDPDNFTWKNLTTGKITSGK